MGQKNSELAGTVPDDQCPYRARAVFQGSNIRTGDGTPPWMLYQEVGATPSSMASAHAAMGVGALKGSKMTTRDAKKAYIQSFIDAPGRPRTWIRLPRFLWPKSWYNADGSPKYKDPVCVLKRALYGHPESGAIWDKKMRKVMKECGFLPVAEGSPGVFYNPTLSAEMIVYVDDFILISPEAHENKIWKQLDKHILFKDPAAPVQRFLGVNHEIKILSDGTCQMLTEGREYLMAAVGEYMKEIGVSSLPWVPSPSIDDKFEEKYAKRGEQADTVLSHLMKIMYLSRLCRGDVLTTTSFLARRCHYWSLNDDRRLTDLCPTFIIMWTYACFTSFTQKIERVHSSTSPPTQS